MLTLVPTRTSVPVTRYRDALAEAMGLLAQSPKTLFIGQAVAYPGQAAYPTFEKVPMERRIELPVFEDFQVGMSFGLALEGYIPVSFFPRWDFLIAAANQLINHLDKAKWLGWDPHVIIRTAVGWTTPHDQGPQHRQDYTLPMSLACRNIKFWQLLRADEIVERYATALRVPGVYVLVERIPLYGS